MQHAVFVQFIADNFLKASTILRSYGFVRTKTFSRHTLFQAGKACVVVTCPQTSKELEYVSRHPTFTVYGIGLAVDNVSNYLKKDLDLYGVKSSVADFSEFIVLSFTNVASDINFYLLEGDAQDKFTSITDDKTIGKIEYTALDHFALALTQQQLERTRDIFTQLFGLDVIYNLNIDAGASGMRSLAVANKNSKIRLPLVAPNGIASQVQQFLEQNDGAGVQHVGLQVKNIFTACEFLQQQGVSFVVPPDGYYAHNEFKALNLTSDQVKALRHYGILFDIIDSKHYLLQVFCLAHNDGNDGPFFFEIIQRCGHDTFTEKNIRALFDSFAKVA